MKDGITKKNLKTNVNTPNYFAETQKSVESPHSWKHLQAFSHVRDGNAYMQIARTIACRPPRPQVGGEAGPLSYQVNNLFH